MATILTPASKFLNEIYAKLFVSLKRFCIVYGGAGAGKSYAVAQYLISCLFSVKECNILVLRAVADTNRNSTFALLRQVISEYGLESFFSINIARLSIRYRDNNIVFAGLDKAEKLKSITFDSGILTTIWVEEADQIKEADLNQLNLRLRGMSETPFQIILTFNPISVHHWLKKRFFDKEHNNLLVIHSTYKDNRFIDEAYKVQLEELKERDLNYYSIYALGEWGLLTGAVFLKYSIKKVNPNLDYYDKILYGIDFGFNHYTAILCVGMKDDNLYLIKELFERKKTQEEIIAINDERGVLVKKKMCYCDSASPESIQVWFNAGYEVSGAKKGKDSVMRGIAWLRSKKITIDVDCVMMIKEFTSAAFKKNKDGEDIDEIIAVHDDGIAALRYACEDYFSGGHALAMQSLWE